MSKIQDDGKYRVQCLKHRYDTYYTLDIVTAINAARMHSAFPCQEVIIKDRRGNLIEWRPE